MNNSAKYLIAAMIIAVGIVGVTFYSCEKEEITPMEATVDNTIKANDQETDEEKFSFDNPQNICGEMSSNYMLSNEGKAVAKYFCYNDNDFFYMALIARKGMVINEAQLQLTTDFEKIPLDEQGNPDFKNFKHTIQGVEASVQKVFRIPISEVHGKTLVTGTAMVTDMMTDNNKPYRVWVAGKEFGNSLKGRVFNYTKGVCLIDQPATDIVEE